MIVSHAGSRAIGYATSLGGTLRLALLLTLAACSGGKPADSGHDSAGTGTTTDAPSCVIVNDGLWAASGSCFTEPTTATMTFDANACTFALTAWTPATNAPTGAAVVRSAVSLTGDGWTDCTGDINGHHDGIDGTCPVGCTWALAPTTSGS